MVDLAPNILSLNDDLDDDTVLPVPLILNNVTALSGPSVIDSRSESKISSGHEFAVDKTFFEQQNGVMEYFKNQFRELNINVESTNALVRQTLVLHKQTSKNMKTYFENENFDGFLSDLDIMLPVSTETELRDLEMRCLNEDFRKSFVSAGWN